MALNEKESKVFTYIKEDPFISQQALADKIGLSRPAVANIISGLVKRGYLLGKAYVVNETRPIVCIGAAAVDRRFFIKDELIKRTSKNVTSETTCGGVALSIAENLGRLQQDVVLLSLVGDDREAEAIKDSMRTFVKVNEIDTIPGQATGAYTEVVNGDGELALALSEMDIYDKMTPNWFVKRLSLLKQAKAIIIDTNLPKNTTEAVIDFALKNKTPLSLVTASVLKTYNIPDDLRGVHLLVVSREDAEIFFDMKVSTDAQVVDAIHRFLDMGAEHVIISDRSRSIDYGSEKHGLIRFDLQNKDSQSYVWGTHEALISGIVYRYLHTKNLVDVLTTGIVNAAMTATSLKKVREDLTQSTLEKDIKAFGEIEFKKLES
ncbi:PfkB family carbohydrate kinase [Jeotgalibaca sp. A122]|uniref:PfkB family carbohydrate kinase n=1 Tax=Jeotgalibaca sp. A122 TaxID=3457322 RepID=UPI003FD0AD80